MKKIYYCLYSLIVLLFLTDDCFASVVSHEENEVRSEVSIRKINRMALGDFRVDDNPKQHYVFFDVDGVLLSEGGSQKNADLLSSQTLQFILGLQQQGVKCFALTARQPRRFLETFQRLNMFGLNFNHPGMGIDFLQSGTRYFKGIIHSPDDKSSDARISSKLQTLQAFMEHLASLGHKSTRISFIDDNAYHFAEQYQKKLNLNQPLDLYHYKRTFAPLYSSWQDLGEYSSQRDKIPNFSELKFVKTLSGGSGGVQVFIDPNGKQWTLKSWKNKHHGINECLAGAMYQKAGGHFPNFYLFNDVPECIKQQLGDTKLHRGGLYRLAEFVEGSQPTQEQLTELLAPNFASLALLSAWDIKPENFIITAEGALYLIDSGGALLHRSLGHRKMATRAKAAKDDMWFRHQVSEFASFRQGDTFGARNFAEITPENIKLQISQLLTARDQLLQQARDFCQAVRYEDTQELLQFFESRLQHLRFLDDFFDGKINPKADPFAFASLNDAAGTLIYKMEDGKPYILLGKRTRHNWWGNLGGKADAGERFYEAGARETLEESGDHLNFQSDILYMPSHDTVTVEDNLTLKRFRTYLAKVDHIDPQTLLQKLTDSSHAKEYSEFAWIAVEEVLQALESGDLVQEENQATIAIVPGGPVLHPPFLQSLQQPQIKQWLQALVSGKEIAGTCSQSVVGHPGLQEITEVVEDPATSSAQRMALWLSLAAQKQAQQQRANKLLKITAEANTASHNMLQHLLDAEAFKISVQDQIKKVIPCLNQKEAELLESIIDQEKFHNDKFVLYHGFDTDLWFNCCVLSSVRHMLDVSPEQTDMLRSLDNFSMEYQNANDLLNFILMGKTNYSKGFKCAGLSCNPTLFNNLRVSSSSTHAYFSGQSSLKPPRPWDITKTMFETLGITTDVLLHDLKALYQNHFGNFNGGALLQIFLKSEIVNQACYIAGSVGATVQDSTDQTVRQALPVLQSLKSGQDPQVQRNTSNIQVRLLADLAKFAPGAVVVQDYLYNAREYNARVNAAQIKQDLKRMLTPYLFPILSKLVCNQEVYSSRAPQTLEILRKTIGIEPYELQACQTPKIVKALNDKQYAEVLNCIIEDPDCLERTYVDDPDSLTENVVKDLQEITSMQQIISDISPEKCQQLFAPVEKLMTTQSWEKEMDKFLQIVKSVNAINCPNPSEFCKEVHHLIPSSAYSSDILRILEALGAMNLTDPAGFCRAVRPLISDAASVLGYLKDMQLSDPVSFCNAVRPLIKVSEYSSDAASVLGYLKDMQLSDPVSFCNAVRPLIKVSEYSSDAARVLGYLKDMQLSDPVSFCNAV
ncbi:MAG: NUDIX domain-containing protein, partial [Pseudomonadota bacterium]